MISANVLLLAERLINMAKPKDPDAILRQRTITKTEKQFLADTMSHLGLKPVKRGAKPAQTKRPVLTLPTKKGKP